MAVIEEIDEGEEEASGDQGEGGAGAVEAPVEDILGDGRLMKQVLVEGDGPCPKPGKRVEVHYETTVVPTGAVIDSSWALQEPFDFVVGEGDVLEAWDLALQTMRPGEKSAITADASLTYGEEGAGDDIPPNATLRFVIELLTGKKPPPAPPVDLSKLPGEAQRIERALEAKERGNELSKEGQPEDAKKAYEEALALLKGWRGTEVEKLEARTALQISCLLNLSQCHAKLEEFSDAVRRASEALDIEPKNCKALYRRAMAYFMQADLAASKKDFLEAARLEPRNMEIRQRLVEVKERMAQSEQWHKEKFGGMFGKATEQAVVRRDLSTLPKVWLDFQIGKSPSVHRVRIVLYTDTAPRTAENFRALCTGEKGLGRCGQPLCYRKTRVHKMVPAAVVEAGDVEKYDGTGGESIYGPTFDDEGFVDAHHKRGLLSMANTGPNTNNSKFLITLRSLPQFDGKHVVFGEVVSGMYVLDAIQEIETGYRDRPKIDIAIVDSGEGE